MDAHRGGSRRPVCCSVPHEASVPRGWLQMPMPRMEDWTQRRVLPMPSQMPGCILSLPVFHPERAQPYASLQAFRKRAGSKATVQMMHTQHSKKRISPNDAQYSQKCNGPNDADTVPPSTYQLKTHAFPASTHRPTCMRPGVRRSVSSHPHSAGACTPMRRRTTDSLPCVRLALCATDFHSTPVEGASAITHFFAPTQATAAQRCFAQAAHMCCSSVTL